MKIRTKEGKVQRFKHKKAQLHYEENRTGRDLILKARQMGFTTYEQLRKLEKVLLRDTYTSATVAHQFGKTKDIFRITQFAWENMPPEFRMMYKVKYDSAKELSFANTGSRYFVDINIRSGTVQDLHVSEVAFIKDIDDLFASTVETVPANGDITFETTANGLNRFHDLWQEAVKGNNEFYPHFYNWTWDEGYRTKPPDSKQWKQHYKQMASEYGYIEDVQSRFNLDDWQFYWYYLKARRLKKKLTQEYPLMPDEAFLSSSSAVFDLFLVNQMVAGEVIEKKDNVLVFEKPIKDADYIIGADTSEGVNNDYNTMEGWRVEKETGKLINAFSFQDNNMRPDQLADLMCKWGHSYNEAFLIPERNNSGITTAIRIQKNDYRNVFINQTTDKKTNKTKNEVGWRTMASNRDMMVDDFIEAWEEGMIEIKSPYIIKDMRTFVRKENGLREHDDGFHDDNLFGGFLGNQGKKFHKSREPEVYGEEYYF